VLAAENTVQLTLNPARPVVAEQTTPITATLKTIKGNKPVTFSDLKIAHTKKLHLLVVDSSLSDYHHIHPRPSKKPGEYVFDFTPKTNYSYRIWADILPISTHHQEYVQADLHQNPDQSTATKPVIDRTVSTSATVDGYTGTLVFDGPVKAGEAVMARITLTKDGQNFAQLEPIMGAFAHVVAGCHGLVHSHGGGTNRFDCIRGTGRAAIGTFAIGHSVCRHFTAVCIDWRCASLHGRYFGEKPAGASRVTPGHIDRCARRQLFDVAFALLPFEP
jgi:hypothetical protein